MENLELYFLRSFDYEIAKELLYYAARLDESAQTLEEVPQIIRYLEHYGLRRGDIGVYAMVDHKVAGGAWVRLLTGEKRGFGYIDDDTPELVFGVKPDYRNRAVGTRVLEQLLREVALSFGQVSLSVHEGNPAIRLYERLGFVKVEGSDRYDPKRDLTTFTMVKKLSKPSVSNEDAAWFEQTQKWRMPQ